MPGPVDGGEQPPPDAGITPVDAGPPDAGATFYESSAWPKWHHDNANTGRSEVDASQNIGEVRFTVPIGWPISPLDEFPATYLMSPVVGFDPSAGTDVVYQLGFGWDYASGVAPFLAIDGPTGETLWSADVTVPEALAQEGTATLVLDRSIYLETGGEQRGEVQAYHLDPQGDVLAATANQEPDGTAGDGYDTCPGFGNDGTLYLYDDDWPLLASFATASGSPVERFIAPAYSTAHVESFSAALSDSNQSVFSWGGMVLSFDGEWSPTVGRSGPARTHQSLGGRLADGQRFRLRERRQGLASDPRSRGGGGLRRLRRQLCRGGGRPRCDRPRHGGVFDWWYDFGPQDPPTDPRYVDGFFNSLVVGYSSPALLHDGAVVFGYLDGVYCFDPPASGQRNGHRTLGGADPVSTSCRRRRRSAQTTLSSWVPAMGNFYAFDGKSGLQRFVVPVGQSAVNSSPAIGSDGTGVLLRRRWKPLGSAVDPRGGPSDSSGLTRGIRVAARGGSP